MNRPAAVTNAASTKSAINSGSSGIEAPPLGSVRTLTEKPLADALAAAGVSLIDPAAGVDGVSLPPGKAVLVTVEVRTEVAATRDALAAAREAAAAADEEAAAA